MSSRIEYDKRDEMRINLRSMLIGRAGRGGGQKWSAVRSSLVCFSPTVNEAEEQE